MKLTNKYMMFATAALLLASCDLDKYPEVNMFLTIRKKKRSRTDLIWSRPK